MPDRVRALLRHVAASEIWAVLPALLVIFYLAPQRYGKQTVLNFLGSPHLPTTILTGVGVWFAIMMLQPLLLRTPAASRSGQSAGVWVPIKAALLVALLLPLPGLHGSVLTHALYAWVQCIG